jgi:hypothetical protein
LFDVVRDKEVRQKLSLFLRSRWFKPPFSGLRMAGLMYDGAIAMGEPKRPQLRCYRPGKASICS